MLDFVRKDENDFTKKEKNEAFNYFSKVISNYIFLNKIDVVFFSHVPHNFFDVLFIQICELNKIKVIFTRSYLLPGFYLFENNLFFTNLKKENTLSLKPLNPGLLNFFKGAKKKFDLLDIKKNIWVDYSLISIMKKQNPKKELLFIWFFLKKNLNFFLRKIFIILKLLILFITDIFLANQYKNFKKYYFIDDFHKEKKSS